MEPLRLPRNTSLSEEGGYWLLRWREDLFCLAEIPHSFPWNMARIGSSTGPDSLSESDALRSARRYLLSHLSPAAITKRALMTVADFVATRFVPEFVERKAIAARAHYHSILKCVLGPERSGRAGGVCSQPCASHAGEYRDWPCLGNVRFADVRSEDVQQLIAAAIARGYSPQTVRHIRSVISAVFSYAKQELVYTGNNPADSVKVPEALCKSAPDLTLSHLEQMLRTMRYPEKQMTLIALLTDMNASEICGLQWKNVNLTGAQSNPHGHVVPPITIAVDKRWYRGELASVKEARRRKIQIPQTLLPMLLLLSARNRFIGPDDFVLTSRSGRAINVTNITARRLAMVGRKLGVPALTWPLIRRAQSAIKADHGPEFQYRIAAAAALD